MRFRPLSDGKGRLAMRHMLIVAALLIAWQPAPVSSLANGTDEAFTEVEFALSSVEETALDHEDPAPVENSSVNSLDMAFDDKPVLDMGDADIDNARIESGESTIDAEEKEEGLCEVPSQMAEERSPNTTIGVFATAEVSPLILGAVAVDQVELHAASAAQTLDGSIEELSTGDTDSVEEAELLDIDDSYDALYRSSIGTVRAVDEGDEAIFY